MNKRFSLLALLLGFFLIAPSALTSDPYRTKINRYVCDYQMVKKGNQIEERRVIIQENGRSTAEGKKMLDEKRFSILKPLFAALRFSIKTASPFFTRRVR